MKRFLCVLLIIFVCVGSITVSATSEEADIKVATANVFSTEYAFDTCEVYFYNDICYMDVADIARYTRSDFNFADNLLTINHGTRTISIDMKSGKLTEDNIKTEIKVLQKSSLTLVHAFPIITYLGASCGVENNNLIINMPEYTVWEGSERTSNEYYITSNELFGNDTEQSVRLILNGILTILDGGLSEVIGPNSKKETFLLAMQVDPLFYDGGWDKKESSDTKYDALITALFPTNGLPSNFEGILDVEESITNDIVLEYLIGAYEDDLNFLNKLKSTDSLFTSASTTASLLTSFFSNLSKYSKCTADSSDMLIAFANHVSKASIYYIISAELQNSVDSEAMSYMGAAKDAVSKESLNLLGKIGYTSTANLIKTSVDISVGLRKALIGDNEFVYATAETAAIELLKLKDELLDLMETLGDKILTDDYSNEQDIEDYRLINVFYYRVLIAINEQVETMIKTQKRENELAMVEVIENLHANTNIFAENLYCLISSKGSSFPIISELSQKNVWDSFSQLKEEATDLSAATQYIWTLSEELNAYSSIAYFNAESCIFKSSITDRYGLIDCKGTVIIQPNYRKLFSCRYNPYRADHYVAIVDDDLFDEREIDTDTWKVTSIIHGGHGAGSGDIVMWNSSENIFVGSSEEGYYKLDTSKNLDAGLHWTIDIVTNNWGYVDSSYAFVVKPQYIRADKFSNGLAAVCNDDGWGYIDESGTIVVPFEYQACNPCGEEGERANSSDYDNICRKFDGKHIAVKKNGMMGIINISNEIVVPFEYSVIMQGKDGVYIGNKNNEWGVITLDGDTTQ